MIAPGRRPASGAGRGASRRRHRRRCRDAGRGHRRRRPRRPRRPRARLPRPLDDARRARGARRSRLTPSSPTSRARRRRSCARADAAGLRFVGGHPMAGRETSGYAAADADLFVGRPWVVVPGTADEAADRPGRGARAGLRRRPVRMDARRARRGGRRDQPPAAGRWPPRWSRPSPAGRRAALRLAGRGRPRGRRLARHDPAGARRRRDGQRRSSRPTPARSPRGSATCAASSTGWLADLERRGGPDEDGARGAAARSARAPRVDAVTDATGARPRRAARPSSRIAAGWYGLRTDGLDGFLGASASDGRYEPRDRDGGRPVVQAGHPVPRPARRRALLPHAADRGRRRRAAPRPLVDRRRRAPQPGRRRAARRPAPRVATRSSSPTSCPTSGSSRCSTTTRPRSARSISAWSSSPTPPAGRSRSARRTSSTGSFATPPRSPRAPTARDVEPARVRRARGERGATVAPIDQAPTAGASAGATARLGRSGCARVGRCASPSACSTAPRVDAGGGGARTGARRARRRGRPAAVRATALRLAGRWLPAEAPSERLGARSARGDPAAPRLLGLGRAGPRRVRPVPAPDGGRARARLPRPRRVGRRPDDVRPARGRGHRGRAGLARRARHHAGSRWSARRWAASRRSPRSRVLGDGSLAAADADPTRRARDIAAPRPRIVAVVADRCRPSSSSRSRTGCGPVRRGSSPPAVRRRGAPLGARPARHRAGPRHRPASSRVPLLLIHGEADTTVPLADGRRLAGRRRPAAPSTGSSPGADHSRASRRRGAGLRAAGDGLPADGVPARARRRSCETRDAAL